MILVFASCSNIQAEEERSSGLICSLVSPSEAFADLKRRYLLQKVHTARCHFDGNGFFYINYKTLVSVRFNIHNRSRFKVINLLLF